ncbi:hypothetical protein ABES02_23145 [Neobacillus pocheonensis]|uniref:hypothetical protein n=1 Tax=Neobacillus pocheonensis TaxID=363869 RepID=UPI003D2E91DD
MNDEWQALMDQCLAKGYAPHDVERMVLLYETFKDKDESIMEQDEMLKEKFWQEENEEAPF